MKTQPGRTWPKKTLVLCSLLITVLTLFTGCIVTSVYPFYAASDVTFDPALIGVWAEPANTNADKETWTFEKIDDRTYKLIVTDKDKKTEFDARLFKASGQLFLDCLVRERHPYELPAHVLLRVNGIQPQLEMQPLDYKWFGELIEKEPRTIRHIVVPHEAGANSGDGLLVLTADTAELQKFILKHLKTKEAWTDAIVMKRQ